MSHRDHHIASTFISSITKLLPTDIIEFSEPLISCFKALFERGTADDCWNLIPEIHKATILDQYRLSNLSSASNSVDDNFCKAGQYVPSRCFPLRLCSGSELVTLVAPVHHSTCVSDRPSSSHTSSGKIVQPHLTISPSLSGGQANIARYFVGVMPNVKQKRMKRLVRIVEGFKEAEALPLESYQNLWSSKSGIFEDFDDGSHKFRRLQQGRRKIRSGSTENDCAARLTSIFLIHDVDHLSQMPKNTKLHHNRKTVAFRELAEIDNTPLETLKGDYKKGRNYLHLLLKGQPGSLLELGSNVSALWEVKISKDDIDLVLDYRKSHLPEIEKRARSLNKVAASAIIDGLVAYGWTFDELLSSGSALIKNIKIHIDIEQHANETRRNAKHKRKWASYFDTPSEKSSDTHKRTGEIGVHIDRAGNNNRHADSRDLPFDLLSEGIPNDFIRFAVTDTSAIDVHGGTVASNTTDQLQTAGLGHVTATSSKPNITDQLTMSGQPPNIRSTDPNLLNLTDMSGQLPDLAPTEQDVLNLLDISGQLPDLAPTEQDILNLLDISGQLPDLAPTEQDILNLLDISGQLPNFGSDDPNFLNLLGMPGQLPNFGCDNSGLSLGHISNIGDPNLMYHFDI
ncbi:hypothetical protein EAF04_010117 [Stromatinia cepivora]|nr:hypothetical protein EAF04_010117 [Stromatinia cepivora]